MMYPPPPDYPHKKTSTSVFIVLFLAGLLVGGLLLFAVSNYQANSLNAKISSLQDHVSSLEGFQNATYQNITIYQNNTALSNIYNQVHNSVVLVQGTASDGTGVQGSGFVYNFEGRNVILTNNHVVSGNTNISVTFSDGHGFGATVLGADVYSDLAVVSVNGADASEFHPVTIVSSSLVGVGEEVIAIGNPYGLVGSLTSGVVSATGRTIQEDTGNRYSIANIIQISAPINPGNSGGPLLNAAGNVVGITTAIVSDSQGLGFAIPSDTILREVGGLVNFGSFTGHSYLGVTGQDMSYDLAQQSGDSVTYGWKIMSIVGGGPSDGKLNVGDIIIALNNQTIKSNDDLASYLEEHTLPGDNLTLTVIRNNAQTTVTLTLGTRPSP
jgi:S1-C subfamily serine protease